MSYTSDNSGVGYSAGGTGSTTFRAAYLAGGGYSGFGITADVGVGFLPCRYEGVTSTWWRYGCSPRSGISGSVQGFFHGTFNDERVIMQETGTTKAFVLYKAILGAYTNAYSGHDFVYWIGFPTGNRYAYGNGYRQNFRYGYILFDPNACDVRVYVGTTLRGEDWYCD